MAVIEWEKKETVAVISMNNGANRQNLVFAQQMNDVFDTILEDKDISSIILTSMDVKNFSQGIDVDWLGSCFAKKDFENIKTFMFEMNRIFKRLLTMPVPVIAAINGHAFGNGAILSCACDFRFMKSDRGFFCFPEVDLGIPFLPGMIAFVRKAFPEYLFNRMKLTGERVTADELLLHHVIEEAGSNQEEMMEKAMAFARGFNKKRGIFGEHKRRMHKAILETMEQEDPPFIEALDLFVQD
ncbi:putative enoyl-CoA hydratase/carnithine racemase [Desulforapulum autotrophicum HRM2]|uniref:Enoyl-CoA hydratase/carnithine racemase n=1 Tax=Desulforapulum autotrophicum (strain ATCC 43914 / DSM 3382 / VKM B-1955 / HRM2) TaxID=177437 RepID=C0QAL8_DESAH|nr:enoyl-CoA hydratase/isomerase family protein [Desulforapulum autotrophicum]ACN16801.1 putative enoyl-CoA hydratase/carnithine racemase [Desulforapulum autotrophicum HRM2]